MAKSYLCTFNELFTLRETEEGNSFEIKKVVIPLIQRDYAQGRKNPDIVRIRERFLDALHQAVCNNGICLDFIYGDIKTDGILTPLDGQQRLTTLFLLHWYAAKKDNIKREKYSFLLNFSYETRYSARDFCKFLIEFTPDFNSTECISAQIIDQAWFPLDWSNDPTIKSMLVMLNEIVRYFSNVKDLWKCLVEERKIQFYFLPIKNMGLTDDLYIKMNSRGKPLTRFEHFKAEFERKIEKIDAEKAKNIEKKIDLGWTDFLWKYRRNDNLTDKLFLNYFKFICDIICYEEGQSPQNRSYYEFDLIEKYFASDSHNAREHLNFLELAFDVWKEFGDNVDKNLFSEFISCSDDSLKVKVYKFYSTDLLNDCLQNYADDRTGRRSAGFSFAKFIMLYAFLQYAIHIKTITKEEFSERIRIVNNLVSNSDDEINDSNSRVGGNRLPAILKQTKSIIVDGVILDTISINYNAYQLEEEKQKLAWRPSHQNEVLALNRIENHELLYGQIAVVGLDNSNLFDRFFELFTCDRDKITCALLTMGDYSRIERNNWRRQLGAYKDTAWKFLFHQSIAGRFAETKKCLVALLQRSNHFDNDILDKIIKDYLAQCDKDSIYDWRYYFVKYKEFRPERYGKYWIEGRSSYCINALWTAQNMSENAYQPFLKIIDPDHIDRASLGTRIHKGQYYLYCCNNSFEVKDENGVLIKSMTINQRNGIDIEERIEKYKSNPLI